MDSGFYLTYLCFAQTNDPAKTISNRIVITTLNYLFLLFFSLSRLAKKITRNSMDKLKNRRLSFSSTKLASKNKIAEIKKPTLNLYFCITTVSFIK